jgi:hypothetical protein
LCVRVARLVAMATAAIVIGYELPFLFLFPFPFR